MSYENFLFIFFKKCVIIFILLEVYEYFVVKFYFYEWWILFGKCIVDGFYIIVFESKICIVGNNFFGFVNNCSFFDFFIFGKF